MQHLFDRIRSRLARRSGEGRRSFARTAMVAGLALAALAASPAPTPRPTDHAELSRIAAAADQQFQLGFVAARMYAAANGLPMTWTLPDGGRAWLVGMDGPYPVIVRTFDRDAAITISADSVWPGGPLGMSISGRTQTIGIWDDGLPSHPEIAGRVTSRDGVTGIGPHATAVIGVAANTGLAPRARGMAFQSLIDAYFFDNDMSELASAGGAGLRISNHSYGELNGWNFGVFGDGRWVWFGRPAINEQIDFGWGFYNDVARQYDAIAAAAPNLLIFQAAGNFRGDGPAQQPVEHWAMDAAGGFVLVSGVTRELNGGATGFDSMPPRCTAKNIVTVGAVYKIPGGYRRPSDVRAASFSSFGPRDDGGIKPDLVAPGVDMFIAEVGGGYGTSMGTSLSSPAAAGAAALLRNVFEVARPNDTLTAAMLKGLMIHTAYEAGPAEGPDYMFGWGLVNTRGGAELIARSEFEPAMFTNLRLRQGQTINLPVAIGGPGEVRVTISWTDPPATPLAPALNDRTSRLVNDIDLRLIRDADGLVHMPYVLDPANPARAATTGDNTVDNVEQIRVSGLEDGAYTIRISHKGTTLLPRGDQDVAVIITVPVTEAIRSLVLRPNRVTGGLEHSFGTVTLRAPAAEATVVRLSTSHRASASVPSSITIPAGQVAGDFAIVTRSVRSRTNVTITASMAGGVASAPLTVDPTTVAAFELSTYDIVGGNTLTGEVTLSAPAPRGGAVVSLTTSAPSVARSVRNWVLVPEGRTSTTFTIRTFPLSDPRHVRFTAARGGVAVRAGQSAEFPDGRNLTVRRAQLVGFTLSASQVRSGGTVTGTVTLNGPAPARGSVVLLRAAPPGSVTIPATVVVPAGRHTGTFTVRAGTVTRPQQTVLTATRFSEVFVQALRVVP
jgi:hypothetical protein